ncbi:hypothetical protein XH79_04750 [Bradyrhizobium sp. CCBAU 45389]|nr:hypothetical protein [Bradyrhizobium sp. CCBAU 45389]
MGGKVPGKWAKRWYYLWSGGIAVPSAMRMPGHIHTAILDVAVITGGLVMISSAARQLVA